MKNKKMPQGIRKFIRKEKSRIRREVLDVKKQKELISELAKGFVRKESSKDKKNE